MRHPLVDVRNSLGGVRLQALPQKAVFGFARFLRGSFHLYSYVDATRLDVEIVVQVETSPNNLKLRDSRGAETLAPRTFLLKSEPIQTLQKLQIVL